MVPAGASGDRRPLRTPKPAPDIALALINRYRCQWSTDPDAGPAFLLRPIGSPGSSNHSFLIQAGEEILVLRLDGIDPADNGIDRQSEFRVQSAAAAEGLAPHPRFCDADAGVFLVEYLQRDPGALTGSAADVGELLRAIHALDTGAPQLSLSERIAHYQRQLPTARATVPDRLLQDACNDIAGGNVICHNDLTPGNRLYHGGCLRALDWEYAARGSPWFDLAVAAGDTLDAQALLSAYLQRPPTAQEGRRLARAALVARGLELLWLACNTDFDAERLAQDFRELQVRLEATAGA